MKKITSIKELSNLPENIDKSEIEIEIVCNVIHSERRGMYYKFLVSDSKEDCEQIRVYVPPVNYNSEFLKSAIKILGTFANTENFILINPEIEIYDEEKN